VELWQLAEYRSLLFRLVALVVIRIRGGRLLLEFSTIQGAGIQEVVLPPVYILATLAALILKVMIRGLYIRHQGSVS
jgi:hypothetical protein